VRVALVEPGPIRTEFGDRAIAAVHALARRIGVLVGLSRAPRRDQGPDRQAEVGPEVVSRAIEQAALTARRPGCATSCPSPRASWSPHARPAAALGRRVVQRLAGLTPRALGLNAPAPRAAR
jgi:hypothetical protein